MIKLTSFATVIFAAGVLSACPLEQNADELLEAAINDAFDQIQSGAEVSGGAALRVAPGQEALLLVNNPASPINGAMVKVPAGAVPSDIEAAAVSIIPQSELLGPNEDIVPNGSAAQVALVELPDGRPIVPAVALTISLPIAADSVRPVEQMVLATLNEGEIVAVEGSKADAAKKHAIGDTTTLEQPFAAGWQVDYIGGPAETSTFIYKVTRADGSTCAGFRGRDLIDDPVVQTTTFEYIDTSIESSGDSYVYGEPPPIQFRLSMGFVNPIEYTHKQPGGYGNLPTGTTASIPVDATFGLTCGGTKYLNDGTTAKATLDLLDWDETAKNAWGDRTDRTGNVNIAGEFDYTTANGDHIQAAFNANLSDFLWTTYP